MSLFSSFDALCAESTGKKVFSWPNYSSSSGQFDRRSSPATSFGDNDHGFKREINAPVKKMEKENSQEVGDQSRRPQRMMKKARNPRFAVELDGVHCFETIVPF